MNRNNDQCHTSANCSQGICGIVQQLQRIFILCHLSCVRRPTLSALLHSPIFHPVCADLRSPLSTLSATDMNCIKQCQLSKAPEVNKKYYHRNRYKLRQRPMLPEASRITQCQLPEGVNRTNDQCHPSANCIQGISGIFRHLTESDLLETVVNCIPDQCCPRAPESYNVSCPRAPE